LRFTNVTTILNHCKKIYIISVLQSLFVVVVVIDDGIAIKFFILAFELWM